MKRPSPSLPKALVSRLANLDSEPIVIEGSKTKAIMLLLACVTLVAMGVAAIAKGEEDVLAMGLPAALIFGLGALIALVQIIRPSVMTITAEGVSVKTIVKTWSVRWDEVDGFFVYRTQAPRQSAGFSTSEMAAFNWIGAEDRPKPFLRIGRAGADGALGPGWPLSAQQLTNVLNAARDRSLAAQEAEKQPS